MHQPPCFAFYMKTIAGWNISSFIYWTEVFISTFDRSWLWSLNQEELFGTPSFTRCITYQSRTDTWVSALKERNQAVLWKGWSAPKLPCFLSQLISLLCSREFNFTIITINPVRTILMPWGASKVHRCKVGQKSQFPSRYSKGLNWSTAVILSLSSHTFRVISHGQLLAALTPSPSQHSQQTPSLFSAEATNSNSLLTQLTHSFVAVFLLDTAVAYEGQACS